MVIPHPDAPDLARLRRVVAAWPGLPERVRATIVTLVKACPPTGAAARPSGTGESLIYQALLGRGRSRIICPCDALSASSSIRAFSRADYVPFAALHNVVPRGFARRVVR